MADWSQSGAWTGPNEKGGEDRATTLSQREHARCELRLFTRRLGILLIALGGMVIAGSIGFAAIEHVSPAYGFDWTVDTVTTLGSIPDPRDAGGRALELGLELFGIGTLFYGLVTVAEFFVSGQLSGVLEERRIEKMIDSFSDHYIVCGFGRVGQQVARDLLAAARELRPDIFIVARASAEDSEKKMLRAGADSAPSAVERLERMLQPPRFHSSVLPTVQGS
jgi:hypothetical protein